MRTRLRAINGIRTNQIFVTTRRVSNDSPLVFFARAKANDRGCSMPPVDDQPVDLGANPVEVDPAIYGDETNRHVDNPFRKCSVHHF